MDKDSKKRVKESGSSYRKKKVKRGQEVAVLSGSMGKFLSSQSQPSSPNIESNESSDIESGSGQQSGSQTAVLSSSLEKLLNVQSQPSSSTTEQNIESTETEMETQSDSEQKSEIEKPIEPHDPHTWPAILSSSIREQIVKAGLPQIAKGKIYPKHDGRCFNTSIFFSTHTNGTRYTREWLVYSQSSDSVYCMFCSIFNRNANSFCAYGRGGSEWKNIKRDVANHESNFKHHLAFKTWLELCKRLKMDQTIDAFQIKMLNKEIDH